jgi:septum formation protein
MISTDTMLYLASSSPRRHELLRQIGVEFELLLLRERVPRGPDVSATVFPGESPGDYARRVCRATARAAWMRVLERKLAPHPVLTAVTVVHTDRELLGKPTDRADAARMLELLSGKTHRVLTAVAIQFEERLEMAVSDSIVRFCKLSPRNISEYVESGEPMDKAGGYAIQGRAAAFIQELRGSYSGVMGLPLCETAELIARFDDARIAPAGCAGS